MILSVTVAVGSVPQAVSDSCRNHRLSSRAAQCYCRIAPPARRVRNVLEAPSYCLLPVEYLTGRSIAQIHSFEC
jgi:hypothetical protein